MQGIDVDKQNRKKTGKGREGEHLPHPHGLLVTDELLEFLGSHQITETVNPDKNELFHKTKKWNYDERELREKRITPNPLPPSPATPDRWVENAKEGETGERAAKASEIPQNRMGHPGWYDYSSGKEISDSGGKSGDGGSPY